MKGLPEERAILLGQYIAENGCTVREAAKNFAVSKSTVHKDVTQRLTYLNYTLWKEVKKILETNKEQRHIRGGNATKEKYMREKCEAKM